MVVRRRRRRPGTVTICKETIMDRRAFLGCTTGAGATLPFVAPTGIAAAPPEAAGKPFLNLRDFGAAVDNKADDGPALQKALDALATAGGGRLVIPPGKFLLKTPARKDFLGKASGIRIEGSGSAGQLVINVGKGATAVRFDNLEHLTVDGVTFAGMPKPRKIIDAAAAVFVSCGEVTRSYAVAQFCTLLRCPKFRLCVHDCDSGLSDVVYKTEQLRNS